MLVASGNRRANLNLARFYNNCSKYRAPLFSMENRLVPLKVVWEYSLASNVRISLPATMP